MGSIPPRLLQPARGSFFLFGVRGAGKSRSKLIIESSGYLII